MRSPARKARSKAADQQPELWPVQREDEDAAEVLMASTSSEPIPMPELLETVSFMPVIEKETLARPRGLTRRFVAPSVEVAPATRAPVHSRRFASFLQATGAVESMQSGEDLHFALPGRSLSKMLRLWKGTESSAACAPVYF